MTYAALAKLKKNSVSTTTVGETLLGATTIGVAELSIFYDVDGVLILKGIVLAPDDADETLTEEITITGASGTAGAGTLTGVTRGVNADGTIGAAYTWPEGTKICVDYTTGIHNQVCDNIAYIYGAISGGDVVGPASSADNEIARFDSTTGKLLKTCNIIITDDYEIASEGVLSPLILCGGSVAGDPTAGSGAKLALYGNNYSGGGFSLTVPNAAMTADVVLMSATGDADDPMLYISGNVGVGVAPSAVTQMYIDGIDMSGLYVHQHFSGTPSLAFGAAGLNLIYVHGDAYVLNTGGFVNGLQVSHSIDGAAVEGGRQGIAAYVSLKQQTAAGNTNRNYVGIAAYATCESTTGDGGTALTNAGAQGAFFALNSLAWAQHGEYLLNVTGMEINCALVVGTSSLIKTGLTVAAHQYDKVHGAQVDAAFAITGQVGAVQFNDGILFTDYLRGTGYGCIQGVIATGTLIRAEGTATAPATYNVGIDFSDATFTSGIGVNLPTGSLYCINDVDVLGVWDTWTPTLTWTGGTPATPTVHCRYKVQGKLVFISVYITSADSNATTGVEIPLPAGYPMGSTNTNYVPACIQRYGNGASDFVNPSANIPYTLPTKIYLSGFYPCVDGETVTIQLSGFYEIA